MTIDYKALAERIEEALDASTLNLSVTFESADLRTVVSLLNGMAEAEPAARIYTDAELVHRDPRWGRVCWIVPECEIDGGALLYLHPAPQPQPEPAPEGFAERLKAEFLRITDERVVKWERLGDEGMIELARSDAVTSYSTLCNALDALAAAPATPTQPPEGATYGIIDPDYGRVYTIARKLAWEEGYAIGLHGSFTRDLDMIAVPWADTACEPEHLIRRIADATGLKVRDGFGVKPHGRLAWTLKFPAFGDPRFIDLSIMPRVLADEKPQPERQPVSEPTYSHPHWSKCSFDELVKGICANSSIRGEQEFTAFRSDLIDALHRAQTIALEQYEPTEAQIEGLAHEVWSASQLAPGEGIADGVERIVRVLRAALAAKENNDADPAMGVPHRACRTPDECRREGVCLDSWCCSSGATDVRCADAIRSLIQEQPK